MTHVVAIDGPSGAGKGTVARAVALALGWAHIDTGAMYRSVAWRVQQRGHSLDDEHQVAEVVATASFVLESDRVMIDTYDVTSAIRTPEMDVAAATVARMPAVRAALVARQREYATSGPLVMEGRDISTVVFPDAIVKIFLDATTEERARRRAKDLTHGFSRTEGIDVAGALATRDRLDRTRHASPLTLALDAVLIDTTGVPIVAVVDRVLSIVREKIGEHPRFRTDLSDANR